MPPNAQGEPASLKPKDLAAILVHAGRAHRAIARQLLASPVRRPDAGPRNRLPVVLYSQVAWDTVWQRPQEQAVGLARHRPVLFVSPVQVHEVAGRLRDRWQLYRRRGHLQVLSPVLLNGEYRNATVRRLNRLVLARTLAPYLPGTPYIFLTNTPFVEPVRARLAPAVTIYDLIDDFCGFGWSPPEGPALENQLLRAADAAFAGTGTLADRYDGRVAGLEFLPSGVHAHRLSDPVAEPEDLRDLPRPRLLYVGTLNDRLDARLLVRVARAFPRGSLVLVGPCHATFPRRGFPGNAHFLGLRPHRDLAAYYQHCDAGLMPFADNAAARAIHPVKTLEYLACGLPVVSTPVPDVVRYYGGIVSVAGPEGFADAVRRELESDHEAARTRRRAFARGRSWRALVDRIEERLRQLEAPHLP